MATPKQLQLRIKYAKTTVNSLTKKLNATKAKIKKYEAELKQAAAAAKKKVTPKKKAAKKPQTKKAPARKKR